MTDQPNSPLTSNEASDSTNTVEDDHRQHSLDIDLGTATPSRKVGRGATKRSSVAVANNSEETSDLLRKPSPKAATSSARRTAPMETSAIIKYGSLTLLVAQMVGLVLLMRYTRTKGANVLADGTREMYLATTAVFMMELEKLLICTVVVFFQSGGSLSGLASSLYQHIWLSPMEVLKLCIPSLLYTIQNNLLYFALSNLDAATYQVCYQLKILTTALFSVILLRRRFSPSKWFALVLLTVGVTIVQSSGSADGTIKSHAVDLQKQNRFLGLVAVLCAACTSGFSGVYFEKILKGAQTSLWIRNIQMGLPSIVIALATVYLKDYKTVASSGFFMGYNFWVWTVVIVQAAGGLIVALVVKYADNVLKVFATSFSIIFSCLVSAMLFDFRPNLSFNIGATLVMVSTVLYARPSAVRVKSKYELPLSARAASRGTRKVSLVGM